MVFGQPREDLIHALLDALEEYTTLPGTQKHQEALLKLACKKAIKAGEPLTSSQIEALLLETVRSGTSPTCPHGRPICLAFTRQELDRRFRR